MKEKKIYVVHFFNFFFNKNCESVCHVEASCEMEAAFIAHASFWKPQREFDFDDYTVYEYHPDSYLTRESVRWTDLESAEAIKNVGGTNAVEVEVIKNMSNMNVQLLFTLWAMCVLHLTATLWQANSAENFSKTE